MSNLSEFITSNQDNNGLLNFNNQTLGVVCEILTAGFNSAKNDDDGLDTRIRYFETGLKWKIGEYEGTNQSSTSSTVQTVDIGFIPDIVFVTCDSDSLSNYRGFAVRRTGEVITDNTTDNPVGNLTIPIDGTTGFCVKSYLSYYKYPHQYLAIKLPDITVTEE